MFFENNLNQKVQRESQAPGLSPEMNRPCWRDQQLHRSWSINKVWQQPYKWPTTNG
jgi:hypothetical protein